MSPIELHVWNRAFGLPSLDPECLAAIAFLSSAIPQDLWVLVESNNSSVSPNGSLPALKNGSQWVGGFDAIVLYITSQGSEDYDIDGNLSQSQRAQAVAYRSFIRKTFLPIVSLSLYVTSKNWVNVTRPLYSTFLKFPIQYEIPHTHHARATALTAHLTSLIRDIAAEESRPLQPVSTAFASITTTADKSKSQEKETIATRVRLRNLLADSLDPIQEKLARQNYFFGGTSPTTIDCLLVGYLSLLLYPDLSSPWAKEILQQEFSSIVSYIDRLRHAYLPSNLPYKAPDANDELTFGSWAKRTIENSPQSWGLRDDIPLNQEGYKAQSTSFWVAVQGIIGLVATAGSVLAYKALTTEGKVDVELKEEVAGKEVYSTVRGGVGDAVESGGGGGSTGAAEGRLPIFRAEDMLGI
ncbi:hypothetical protein TWF730_005479 [Orbilia blumenaviensis]|uniref:Mitochondrial outer membrane transport complex Sam37/metaxin N-terminal domain-containing protein n=1 Tax=Orbilia blumenaviensis TaxID=1796055 RepID=A0AAV9VKV3_9PEZI